MCNAPCAADSPWCHNHQPTQPPKDNIRRVIRVAYPVPEILPYRDVRVAGWFDVFWGQQNPSLECALDMMRVQMQEYISSPIDLRSDPHQLAIVRLYGVSLEINRTNYVCTRLSSLYDDLQQHPSISFVLQFLGERPVLTETVHRVVRTTPLARWPFAAILLHSKVDSVWIDTRIFDGMVYMWMWKRLQSFFVESWDFPDMVIYLTLTKASRLQWFAKMMANPSHVLGRNCLGIFVDQTEMDVLPPLERAKFMDIMIYRRTTDHVARERPIKVAENHMIKGAHRYICTTNAQNSQYSMYRINGVDICVQDTIEHPLMDEAKEEWKTGDLPITMAG